MNAYAWNTTKGIMHARFLNVLVHVRLNVRSAGACIAVQDVSAYGRIECTTHLSGTGRSEIPQAHSISTLLHGRSSLIIRAATGTRKMGSYIGGDGKRMLHIWCVCVDPVVLISLFVSRIWEICASRGNESMR